MKGRNRRSCQAEGERMIYVRFKGQLFIKIVIGVICDGLRIMLNHEFKKGNLFVPGFMLLVVPEKHR